MPNESRNKNLQFRYRGESEDMSDTKFGKNIDQIENRVGDATDDDFEPAVPAVPDKPEPTHTCAACYAPIWLTPDGWRSRLDYKCSSSGEDSGGHRPAVPDKVATEMLAPMDKVLGECGFEVGILKSGADKVAPERCGMALAVGGGVVERCTFDAPHLDRPHSFLPQGAEPLAGAQVPQDQTEAECATCEQSVVREPHDPLYGPGRWRHVKPYAGEMHAAEPQAGAQVPSGDARFTIRWDSSVNAYKVSTPSLLQAEVVLAGEYDRIVTHLATIRSYVLEAAKTPISREDMHDAMKAQTYYDESEGLRRLILSEAGGER